MVAQFNTGIIHPADTEHTRSSIVEIHSSQYATIAIIHNNARWFAVEITPAGYTAIVDAGCYLATSATWFFSGEHGDEISDGWILEENELAPRFIDSDVLAEIDAFVGRELVLA